MEETSEIDMEYERMSLKVSPKAYNVLKIIKDTLRAEEQRSISFSEAIVFLYTKYLECEVTKKDETSSVYKQLTKLEAERHALIESGLTDEEAVYKMVGRLLNEVKKKREEEKGETGDRDDAN